MRPTNLDKVTVEEWEDGPRGAGFYAATDPALGPDSWRGPFTNEGDAELAALGYRECEECHGCGDVLYGDETCPVCKGAGWVDACPGCDGTRPHPMDPEGDCDAC